MTIRARLLRWVENLLIAGFVLMIAMVFGNVLLRYGFNSGIIASEEVSRLIFVWLTFGGAFLVAKDGNHLGMNTVVLMLGRKGRWRCRLVAEILSLVCMVLLVKGCWHQAVINIDNHAPITGVPLAVTYLAGLLGGIGIGAINLIALARLLTGRMPESELIIGAESEEQVTLDARQAEGAPR